MRIVGGDGGAYAAGTLALWGICLSSVCLYLLFLSEQSSLGGMVSWSVAQCCGETSYYAFPPQRY